MILGDEPQQKRKPLGKTAWTQVLKDYGYKCVLCGITEVKSGGLEQAHIVPHSSGGTQVRPMCATCHRKHDRGKLTVTEQRKLGYTPQTYKRLIPAKKKKETYFDGSEVIRY